MASPLEAVDGPIPEAAAADAADAPAQAAEEAQPAAAAASGEEEVKGQELEQQPEEQQQQQLKEEQQQPAGGQQEEAAAAQSTVEEEQQQQQEKQEGQQQAQPEPQPEPAAASEPAAAAAPTVAAEPSPAPAPAAEAAAAAELAPAAAGSTEPPAAPSLAPLDVVAAGAGADSEPQPIMSPPGGMLRGQSALDLQQLLPPIVICGPSGVGKGTIIEALMTRNPGKFAFCVSHTTRGPRPGEVNGQHYHFVEMEVMRAAVDKGVFLEHAHVHGNLYGTSLAAVAAVSAEGKVAILDIDVQGTEQVRASCLGTRCLCLFIAPPSHAELERRLRGRGTETEDKVLKRLANATSEIEKSKAPGLFDATIVNDDLETAVLQVAAAIDGHARGTVPGADEALACHLAAKAAAAAKAEAAAAAAAAAAAEPAEGVQPQHNQPPADAAPAAAAAAAAATLAAPAAAAALAPGPAAGAAAAAAAAPAPPAGGGTATLLDFGFGSTAGPGLAAKGMPVRAYMDATVVPVLRDGLKALNVARPDDPLQFLADFILAQRAARHEQLLALAQQQQQQLAAARAAAGAGSAPGGAPGAL